MLITEAQVQKTAELAKLVLDKYDLTRMVRQLRDLLEYAEVLAELPPEKMPAPSTRMGHLKEMPSLSMDQAEVLALSPDSCQGMIRVPRVMDDE